MMKLSILICVICFALLGSGCSRGRHTNANSTAIAEPGAGSAGDRNQARVLVEKGKEFYHNDQDEEAAEAFKQAIGIDPELAEGHFRLGLAYEALNKQEEAEAEYKKAVEAYKKYLTDNSSDAEAHYDLGQTYAGLHQYSDAIREYRQASKLKADDPAIYYDLGTAHMKLAQYDEAAGAFKKSLDIDPENYRAQDALDEAREGVKRIQDGKKHQKDLYEKQKEEELKKAGESLPGSSPSAPAPPKPSATKRASKGKTG